MNPPRSPLPTLHSLVFLLWLAGLAHPTSGQEGKAAENESFGHHFQWEELPGLPDELGVAGPFAGVHEDCLIVAGGANFPRPVWNSDKIWRDRIFVLSKSNGEFVWHDAGRLSSPRAYGTSVSTPHGLLCMGGNHSTEVTAEVFLLRWDPKSRKLNQLKLSSLPEPNVYASATLVGNQVYIVGGQSDQQLSSATKNFWKLDLPPDDATDEQLQSCQWNRLSPFPGHERAFHITTNQHNGFNQAIYVFSGRRLADSSDSESVEFLRDVWEFDLKTRAWKKSESSPRCVMAGTGISVGQSHILIAGGADGARFFQSDKLKDRHPGFPKSALLYHTITNRWSNAGDIPANHVTTIAVKWGDRIIIPSGEIRPRVRSNKVWSIKIKRPAPAFGWLNYSVLFTYLLLIVGIGFWYSRKQSSTDEFFRGGKSIPWWAAGCSIFATMLSSLTYTGVPSKAYAQDWVYAIGNAMIPVVAIAAVFIALPFFRRIDATSAYEYLELRFNRGVRWFGSASFTLFHVFRMAVVMSLTALALSVATPLSPAQSVLLMGALSILYCSLGGIEAVIWTDTVQTVVLLIGAVTAFLLLLGGIDGGWNGYLQSGTDNGKFNLANFHLDATDAKIAFWVIILGGIAQNISSYTSDQAVVQRYMTTADQKLAARSIWTNAVLTIPATLLFFGIGTALYVFYRDNPQRLDPTIQTDQIFPMFIALEMPIGLAGLLVAGIFAAAQSTVSTSMNSTATAIVTDFLKPVDLFQNDRSYLKAARWLTVVFGLAGTGLALLFVGNPEVKSLFDTFIVIIGLFMGVLGGLFVLGVCTRRANGAGALSGAFFGAGVMLSLWLFTSVNGYLYTAVGISSCFLVGYLVSLLTRSGNPKNLQGLTWFN